MWVEWLLRNAGDDPGSPKCLLLAPTGVAAHLIGKSNYFKSSLTVIFIVLSFFRRNNTSNWISITQQEQLPHPCT